MEGSSRVGHIYSAVVYVTRWPVSANLSFAAKHVVRACPTPGAVLQQLRITASLQSLVEQVAWC